MQAGYIEKAIEVVVGEKGNRRVMDEMHVDLGCTLHVFWHAFAWSEHFMHFLIQKIQSYLRSGSLVPQSQYFDMP